MQTQALMRTHVHQQQAAFQHEMHDVHFVLNVYVAGLVLVLGASVVLFVIVFRRLASTTKTIDTLVSLIIELKAAVYGIDLAAREAPA